MTPWQYTDSTNTAVYRTLDNGGIESCVATREDVLEWVAAGNTILVAPTPVADIPDLATQTAAALLTKGTLTAKDFHPDTLAAVNADVEQAKINGVLL